jgi:hypothetical protein
MNEQERQVFLAEPRVGVLSVASGGDRPPLTMPVWYNYEPGGNVTFFTGTQGRRARKTALIEAAGVASLCAQHGEFPYKYVTVECTVVGADRPPAAEQMLAIVRRYLPEEMAQGFVAAELGRDSDTLVLFTLRPDRWLAVDFGNAVA